MMFNFTKYLKDSLQHKNIGPDGKRKKRSPKWKKVRKEFLKKNPRCALCNSMKNVEVHHIISFSIDPSLELNHNNLISLCENKRYGINCHLLSGHLGNYRRTNPSVELDALVWNKKIHGDKK